ncbi:hypothetical protein MAFF241648_21140 [Ralstonia solanacearum]|nr:hypothetical protein MAFF241648_21140 [Ralstonia solanacearum]
MKELNIYFALVISAMLVTTADIVHREHAMDEIRNIEQSQEVNARLAIIAAQIIGSLSNPLPIAGEGTSNE